MAVSSNPSRLTQEDLESIIERALEEARARGASQAEAASSAVNRAMLQALATVARTASGEKSAVLADPLRRPKYTVTPMLRSR